MSTKSGLFYSEHFMFSVLSDRVLSNHSSRRRDTVLLKLVLSSNYSSSINFNAKSYCQNTPIHFAIKNGQTEVVQLLVNYGVDLTIKDQEGDTPLYLACQRNSVEIVKILLKLSPQAIDLGSRNEILNNFTALQFAFSMG